MKRLTTLLALTAMLSSLTGCCCWWPWYGSNCGSGCGYPGFGGPAAGTVPSGSIQNYQSYDAVTGLPLTTTTAYQPVMTVPAVTLGPLEALPTYR